MILLLKKRTVFLVFFAFLALVAVACVFPLHRDKQVISTENVAEQTVIVLDAGHGGEDGGAVSSGGVPESSINLRIVKKLELLFAFIGQPTTLTRDGEDAIYSEDAQTLREKKVSDLNNRVALVNSFSSGFLISIHQNSLPNSKAKGAQVFYNGVDPAQGVALSVQQALNASINTDKAKTAKQIDSSIYLMRKIQRAGILVECGFMSNDAEVKLLQTDTHQRRISAAVVSGYLQSRTERK